mgnify:CR=1 FL=1
MRTDRLPVTKETAAWVLTLMSDKEVVGFLSELLDLYLQGKEPKEFTVEFKRKKAKV